MKLTTAIGSYSFLIGIIILFLFLFVVAEIFRVSGMMSNQGFTDFDRLRHRSPSPMASPNHMSNVPGAGYGGWNGLPPEVAHFFLFICYVMISVVLNSVCFVIVLSVLLKETSFFALDYL